ncbi:MAG: 16S rRNA (uracil(1498)-N(3))-methyltransferase [Clostridia bacterium]|nr:16S rRNA (uracil(1498)-N(3))-methyltransferase [Clostridia bacterium]
MPRFFANQPPADDILTLTGDDAYHIARALRMAVGDEITVCHAGVAYRCALDRIRDEEVLCKVLSESPADTESPVKITLYMAYPKGDKLETVTQKAVELGASVIVPYESSRCIKRPKADRVDKSTERLSRIAAEAAKQSGRGILPSVLPPISYRAMLGEAKTADLPIFCYEGDGCRSLKEILNESRDVRTVSIVIGSEGGFSPEEAALAAEAGFKMANLGPRILRCETAPAFALAAVCYHFEL